MRSGVGAVAAFLAAFLCVCVPLRAGAQVPPAEIEVRVTDAGGKPLGDARVFISGPLTASALTPKDGIIRFTDVEPGVYRLRVVLRGYASVDANEIEALAGRRKVVEFALRPPGAVPGTAQPAASPAPGELQEIGRVRARPPVVTSSVDVDEGNPIRRISENLADALDKIGGISVSQDQQLGTLTVSLQNADPSRTLATAGGSPLLGGGASQLQSVAADLSTGVSTDNSGLVGLGGAVNFRTLEPTKTWQAQTSASYGGYERGSLQFSVSGSYHKLGVAVQHAERGGDSVLTGLRFQDVSGSDYVHDGAYSRDADFVKLRYPVGHLNISAGILAGINRSSPLCLQFVTVLPCGNGPGASLHGGSRQQTLGVQGQVGNVIVNVNAFGNTYNFIDDEPGRAVGGVPTPFHSDTAGHGAGVFTSTNIPFGRHTLIFNVGTFGGHGRTLASGNFQGSSSNDFRNAFSVIADTLKFSDRWSATVGYGTNVTLAETRSAADIAVVWTPSRQETLRFGIGNYGNGANYTVGGSFGDPAAAQYSCAVQEVRVTGPSDAPTAGSQTYSSVNYSRRGRRGTLRVNAYTSIDRNSSEQAQFPLVALPPGSVPPGYLDAIGGYWHAPAICGATPFDPSRVYVAQLVSGVTTRSIGVDASGQLVLGRNVIALPSYSINSIVLASADPRLLFPGSPVFLGSQLPFRPLHKAGLLIDAVQPKAALEWVVNGTWVAGNNAGALGPYIQVAAGLTWSAKRGRVTLFANNLFNADTGLFATQEFAQPLALRGGGVYIPVPTLLPPRAYTLLYSVRAGRLK